MWWQSFSYSLVLLPVIPPCRRRLASMPSCGRTEVWWAGCFAIFWWRVVTGAGRGFLVLYFCDGVESTSRDGIHSEYGMKHLITSVSWVSGCCMTVEMSWFWSMVLMELQTRWSCQQHLCKVPQLQGLNTVISASSSHESTIFQQYLSLFGICVVLISFFPPFVFLTSWSCFPFYVLINALSSSYSSISRSLVFPSPLLWYFCCFSLHSPIAASLTPLSLLLVITHCTLLFMYILLSR